jgi:hypothetical protein
MDDMAASDPAARISVLKCFICSSNNHLGGGDIDRQSDGYLAEKGRQGVGSRHFFVVFPDPRHSNGRLPLPDRKTANVKMRYNIGGMRHKAGLNRCHNLKNLSGSLKWTF